MQAISKSGRVYSPPDDHFGLCIFLADATHPVSNLGRHCIRHLLIKGLGWLSVKSGGYYVMHKHLNYAFGHV